MRPIPKLLPPKRPIPKLGRPVESEVEEAPAEPWSPTAEEVYEAVEQPSAKVVLFPDTPGQRALDAACLATGQSWGLVKFKTDFTGNGSDQRVSKATILVGIVYEVDGEGDVDALYAQLAADLPVSGG